MKSPFPHFTEEQFKNYQKCVSNLKVGDKIWIYTNRQGSSVSSKPTDYEVEAEVLCIIPRLSELFALQSPYPWVQLYNGLEILVGTNYLLPITGDRNNAYYQARPELKRAIDSQTKWHRFKILSDAQLISRIQKKVLLEDET